jgi:hypothetical protein
MAHVLGVPKNYEEAHFQLDTHMLFAPPIFLRYGTARNTMAAFGRSCWAKRRWHSSSAQRKAHVRMMNSAAHSSEDLETALAAFERAGKSLGVI